MQNNIVPKGMELYRDVSKYVWKTYNIFLPYRDKNFIGLCNQNKDKPIEEIGKIIVSNDLKDELDKRI